MKLAVRKHDIRVVRPQRLVSGSVNIVKCEFRFDESWDGYGKTAVFAAFSGAWAVPLVENTAVIPWEALEAGRRLRIGVYGVNGEQRLPTVYTEPLFVETGAEEGKETGEPSQSKWEQLLAAIEEGLIRGEDGHTPVKGKDYFTEAEINEITELAAARVGDMGAGSAVQYVAQSLTEAQQAQARENIGAIDREEADAAVSEALGAFGASFEEFDRVLGLTEEDYAVMYDASFADMDSVTGGE